MKTLAEFLANSLVNNYCDLPSCSCIEVHKFFVQKLIEGIEAYKNHLKNDSPRTVHWAMIERDLIVALERMQSQDSLEGARHSNKCASHNEPPSGFASSVSECDCKPIEDMTTKEIVESVESVESVSYPICPLNIYFEGDEDKFDLKKCDFFKRGCTNACNKNSKGDFKCHT